MTSHNNDLSTMGVDLAMRVLSRVTMTMNFCRMKPLARDSDGLYRGMSSVFLSLAILSKLT